MTQVHFAPFQFDPADGSLSNLDTDVQITLRPQVAKLLGCLLEYSGRVVDRDTICLAIWGEGAVVDFESGLAAIVKELRQSFERLGGSAAMLETIPRRGYRLKLATEPQPGTLQNEMHERDRSKRVISWRRSILALLALIAAAGIWLLLTVLLTQRYTESSHSLVILPFERYGDLEQVPEHAEYLIADTLLARLWEADLQGLELIGRSSVLAYSDRPNVAASVARELGANRIIEGDLVTEARGWRVEARLLELPSGRVVWSESIRVAEEPGSIDQIASRLVQSLSDQWPQLQNQP